MKLDVSKITYKAKLISIDGRYRDYISWSISLNNSKFFDFYVGIGRYIKQEPENEQIETAFKKAVRKRTQENAEDLKNIKIKDFLNEKISDEDISNAIDTENLIFKNGILTIKKPNIYDVIYCLNRNAVAIYCDYYEWCDFFGEDDECPFSFEKYKKSQEEAFIYKYLPINHEKANEFFKKYHLTIK